MTLISSLIVALAFLVLFAQIAGLFTRKATASRNMLLCFSFIGSLAVLVLIIWMLYASAAQGDWRAIEDTAGAWLLCATAFSVVSGGLFVGLCLKR